MRLLFAILLLAPTLSEATSATVTVTASIASFVEVTVVEDGIYWASNSPEALVIAELDGFAVVLPERDHWYTPAEVYALRDDTAPQFESLPVMRLAAH